MQKLGKLFISLLAVLLCIILLLCGCKDTTKVPIASYEFKYTEDIYDYGAISIGSCKKLIGNVYTLVIFLDDSESSWDEEARKTFYDNRYFPSINYLSEQAAERDVELNLQSGQYTTKSDLKTPIKHNGKVANSIKTASLSLDLLNTAATALGFTDAEYMDLFLKKNLNADQIAYVLVVNKPGSAYAVYDSKYDDTDELEFVIAFSKSEDGRDNIGSSTLHELLHLFGASDLYDDSGVYKSRFELCKKLYPNDIMMKSAVNPDSLEIGALTECLIGWSEYFPTECDCPEWWKKSN